MINGWFAGNYPPTFGMLSRGRGVPRNGRCRWRRICRSRESFDLNAAVRRTDYSTSGLVTTWKAGATWQPIDDLRFRVTRSRDIRAPT